jgi:large subunit ribosomal protein L25
MTNGLEINASLRVDTGTSASRRLRHKELIPAVLYGSGKDPVALTIAHKDMRKALENHAFYSSVVTVNIGNDKIQAVLKALQRHPYKPKITHVDFLRVSSEQIITMRVPFRFVGEDIAPGVKLGGGIVSHLLTDIEVQCKAAHLPEYIEVDLSKLGIDQSIHLSDLVLSEHVVIPALAQGADHDLPIASIHVPRGGSEQGDADQTAAGGASADK